MPHAPGNPVLAHYTEHLVWLQSFGQGALSLDRDSNAWTGDYTVGYWLSGAPEDLGSMLQQLKRVFAPLDLPRDFAEEERGIVLREYDTQMANKPHAQAAEVMEAFLYEGNSIARSVIGTPAEIDVLRYEDAKAFHAMTHRPERAHLLVTGDITPAKLRRTMAAVGFPDLGANLAEIAPPPFTLAAAETRVFRYPDPKAAPWMTWRKVVTLPRPVDFDLLLAQTALTEDILYSTLPGGLAGPLRFDAFVTKSFSLSVFPIDETHVEMFFSAEPDEGVTFAELQSAFEAALRGAAEGVPPATYTRVKERFTTYWPDWSDKDEAAQWMANYARDRLANLRLPKAESELRPLEDAMVPAGIDSLLKALAGPGRIAIAFFGTEPRE